MYKPTNLWISLACVMFLIICVTRAAQRPRPTPSRSSPGAGSQLPPQPNEKILDVEFKNPAYNTNHQLWAKSVCSNGVWLHGKSPRYEWTPVLNPQQGAEDRAVAVSGIALNPHLSTSDVWFTHPFGNDWTVDVAWESNPNFDFLVSPRLKSDADADRRRLAALQSGLKNPRVIHVEMDADFIPPFFQASAGDRVAVFGRWIVDCGHDTFDSEIHPPLMFVKATPGNDGISTRSTVISRPYLVSQEFEGGSLYEHLLKELGKATNPAFPVTAKMTARPKIITTPFSGVHWMTYYVRPPVKQRLNERLLISYHFTVRTGVAVNIFNVGDASGTIGIAVVMNSSPYLPAALPAKRNWNIPIEEIKKYENLGPLVLGIQSGGTALYGNPFAALVLQRGIDTDRYQLPTFAEPPDTRAYRENLRNNTRVIVDDRQPFPIRGSLEVKWVRDPRTIYSKTP